MEVSELLKYRNDILASSKDEDEFIHSEPILLEFLPYMLDAKLIDSEDVTVSYFSPGFDNLKINAYTINESRERLQLFLVNDEAIDESATEDELCISVRAEYDKQLKKGIKFFKQSLFGDLCNKIQDSDGVVKSLVAKINSEEGIKQFDVVEIFLLSLTATVSYRGETVQPRKINFDDEKINVKYQINGTSKNREILVLKKVIDLNFLGRVIQSRGNREPLTINFTNSDCERIEVIKAADEKNFASYLCVLNAQTIANLYKRYSSRLLEKNVRSFLQFQKVNKGIKETIREKPEHFVAYNNGLTITASAAEIKTYKKTQYLESLTDFQIVNGGQTTATIYFSQKDGLDISKVNVMAKINVAKDVSESDLDDLISNISKFSNTQTKVTDVDLRSKSPQLRKIKSLSESIVSPHGTKWFFERAKGEFLTKVRHAGSKGNQLKKEFSKEKRYTNMELAKYYNSWGDSPWLVKKGGTTSFRHFIELLEASPNSENYIEINRDFYEGLIAKMILFKRMEKIYGQGKRSIGQLRAAVIPYSLALIFNYTDGQNESGNFNFEKIWKAESIDNELSEYLEYLMKQVNDLIKYFSPSDDYNEYSRKQELWDVIKDSSEARVLMTNDYSSLTLKSFTS